MLTEGQRKKAIEEATRVQNIHFIGLKYEHGKEIEVYHRQRFVSQMQASKMAMHQTMGSNISCVNILTDDEYEQYRKQKQEKTKAPDGSLGVPDGQTWKKPSR